MIKTLRKIVNLRGIYKRVGSYSYPRVRCVLMELEQGRTSITNDVKDSTRVICHLICSLTQVQDQRIEELSRKRSLDRRLKEVALRLEKVWTKNRTKRIFSKNRKRTKRLKILSHIDQIEVNKCKTMMSMMKRTTGYLEEAKVSSARNLKITNTKIKNTKMMTMM